MPIRVDALMSMAQPAFAAMAEFNGKLLENAARLNAEWAEFLGRRLQEDIAVPQRLAACKSPQEAQDVCVDYWKTAFAQYQDELGRLAKMNQTFTQQATTAMQKRAEAMMQETQIAA
jgi:hypothetical protein